MLASLRSDTRNILFHGLCNEQRKVSGKKESNKIAFYYQTFLRDHTHTLKKRKSGAFAISVDRCKKERCDENIRKSETGRERNKEGDRGSKRRKEGERENVCGRQIQ